MTNEEAVKILNKKEHNNVTDWEMINDFGNIIIIGEIGEYRFTEFEALAIAEKYQRENLLGQ